VCRIVRKVRVVQKLDVKQVEVKIFFFFMIQLIILKYYINRCESITYLIQPQFKKYGRYGKAPIFAGWNKMIYVESSKHSIFYRIGINIFCYCPQYIKVCRSWVRKNPSTANKSVADP
jgi:hypothetical protein